MRARSIRQSLAAIPGPLRDQRPPQGGLSLPFRSGSPHDPRLRYPPALRRPPRKDPRAALPLSTARQALGAGDGYPRVEPCVHRRLRGQSRPAGNAAGLRCDLRWRAMGDDRLPAGARRVHAHWRLARRPVRTAPRLHRRHEPLRARRRGLRAVAFPAASGGRAPGAGAGGRVAGSHEPRAHRQPFRRRGARPRDWHLGRGVGAPLSVP
jgi:hypothetical protein